MIPAEEECAEEDRAEANSAEEILPVSHSIPDTQALAELLTENYGLDVLDVRFIRPGLNDVFEVATTEGPRILRVYRSGRRSDDDIRWEAALLAHLRESGVPVTGTIATTDGRPFVTATAPEGRRQLLLMDFAEGRLLRGGKAKGTKPSVREWAGDYGVLAARVHSAADGFDAPHPRFALDVDHLVRAPEMSVAQALTHRPSDRRDLAVLADELADEVSAALPSLDLGPCHGDLTGDNAVLRDGRLTLFDFDCGGPGPRAYDIGVFSWSMGVHHTDPEVFDRFVAGYRSVRSLPAQDWNAVQLFAAVRQLWFMGMQTANAADWGHFKADDDFLDVQLSHLRTLVSQIG